MSGRRGLEALRKCANIPQANTTIHENKEVLKREAILHKNHKPYQNDFDIRRKGDE